MSTITGAPEIIIPKKNIVLDATVLSTLMGCGRLTDFRFNHNLVGINGKSNSLEVGSLVHKYLEVYYGHVIQRFSKSQAHQTAMIAAELYARGCPYCTNFEPTHCNLHKELPANEKIECEECIAKPKCGHYPNEYEGIKNTPYEKDKDKAYVVPWKWALDTCEQYYEFYKNDFWVPLEVEIVKGKILYEDDEIRVLWKSKFDLITDTNQAILPCDHKTMKQRRDTVSLNNQFMGQCLVQDTRNIVINKIGFQSTLKPEEKFIRAIVSYSAKRLIEWQGTILPYWAYKLVDYSENEYWPPNFDHCENKYGNCPFMEVCEADPDMREHELKLHFMVGPDWNPTNQIED
jgi:hypothetical protein